MNYLIHDVIISKTEETRYNAFLKSAYTENKSFW